MLLATMKHHRLENRGISNVIVVMLSLVLVVIIVSNVVLWSYQMNQFDLERMQESIEISGITQPSNSEVTIALQNRGSVTAHLVSLWVDTPKVHQRYDINLFINIGDLINYTCTDIGLVDRPSLVKIITERGTISVFRLS